MHHRSCTFVIAVILAVLCSSFLFAEEAPEPEHPSKEVRSIKPAFLPPSEILAFLGVETGGGLGFFRVTRPDGVHIVEVRHNDAANLLILAGAVQDVDYVERLIRKADIPPKQIEIEVKIVEVNTAEASDLGIDWQNVLDYSRPTAMWVYDEDEARREDHRYSGSSEYHDVRETDQRVEDLRLTAQLPLERVLKILDESGAGSVRSAPRILTLNNRRATILDGERVTYVTRYSSYANLFEADSMDAGLTLSVLPSLGESGYMTLHINAELTALGGSISGSPVKRGQMIENTVMVRDGETISLGGLTRTVDKTVVRRFPLLGHVIPILFARETTIHSEIESYIVLTPRVIDLAGTE